ncbi:MAG: hypothetical protein ACOYI8_06670 [Christensenellales bacterium]|jgi:drug/metabolite transporter (DMT)-like permease
MQSVVVVIACVVLFSVKSLLNKIFALSYEGDKSAATPVFAMISCTGVAIATWAFGGFSFTPSGVTWGYGLLNGIALFLLNLSVIQASLTGPYAFQSLMCTSGCILMPLVFTVLLGGEKITSMQATGIAIMLVSFVLFNAKGLTLAGAKKGYLAWVSLLFFSNGFYGVLLEAQQVALARTERDEMITITFSVCAIISLVYLLVKKKSAIWGAFRMSKKSWLCALSATVLYTVATNLVVLGLSLMHAPIFHTSLNGGVLIFSVLLGTAMFREKFDIYKGTGLALAVVALVLL